MIAFLMMVGRKNTKRAEQATARGGSEGFGGSIKEHASPAEGALNSEITLRVLSVLCGRHRSHYR